MLYSINEAFFFLPMVPLVFCFIFGKKQLKLFGCETFTVSLTYILESGYIFLLRGRRLPANNCRRDLVLSRVNVCFQIFSMSVYYS